MKLYLLISLFFVIIIGLWYWLRYYFQQKNYTAIVKGGFNVQKGIEVKLYKLETVAYNARTWPQIKGLLFFDGNTLLLVSKKFGIYELYYLNKLPMIIKLGLVGKNSRIPKAPIANIVELSPRAFKIKTEMRSLFSTRKMAYTVRLKNPDETNRIKDLLDNKQGRITKNMETRKSFKNSNSNS